MDLGSSSNTYQVYGLLQLTQLLKETDSLIQNRDSNTNVVYFRCCFLYFMTFGNLKNFSAWGVTTSGASQFLEITKDPAGSMPSIGK